MSDNDHRLYWYENTIEIFMTTTEFYVRNQPMNNRKLKAHKGITNTLKFIVRDRDRKLQDVSDSTLCIHVFDPITRRKLFTKQMIDTGDIGKLKFELTAGDLVNIDPGLYHGYVSRNHEGEHHALYKDVDNNIRFDIEVTDQVGQEPVATQVVDTYQTLSGQQIFGPMDGNIEDNFINAQHTIAIKFADYTGTVTIQGSLICATPGSTPDSLDWFTIDSYDLTDFTGVRPSTYIVNANWIRVVSTTTDGEIVKVELRN